MSPSKASGAASPTSPSRGATPRWLTASQQQAWRAYLKGSAQLRLALEAALRKHQLSLPEYEILVRLSEAPDHTERMSELATAVEQSRSRLTHTVARMQCRGLVERRSDACDGRGVLAVLTDVGLRTLVETAPTHVASVRDAFVDVVEPADFEAIGRAFAAVSAAAEGVETTS